MARLTIENFGPIKHFDGDVDDFSLIIGQQASGKSTIAQLVYFFKMFPEYLASNFLSEVYPFDLEPESSFREFIKQKFLEYFGPFSPEAIFRIQYYYSSSIASEDTLGVLIYCTKQGYEVAFTGQLVHNINQFIKKVRSEENNEKQGLAYYTGVVQAKEAIISRIDYLRIAKQIFQSPQTPIYIPAGRVLFPLISGQPGEVQFFNRQFVLRDYSRLLSKLRPTFYDSLEEIEKNAKPFTDAADLADKASLARELITDVLGGKFEIVKNDERLYHRNEQEFTLLPYASSGQQETVWIALLAYLLILEAKPVFVVFEEPESHLYPVAQNSILRLLVLAFLANENNSVMVTTHSPYILSATNNLIFAHNIVSEQPDSATEEKINAIIDRHLWLPFERVHAYKSGEQFEEILDTEQKMIKTELIDEVSAQLNVEFDQLLENLHD